MREIKFRAWDVLNNKILIGAIFFTYRLGKFSPELRNKDHLILCNIQEWKIKTGAKFMRGILLNF